MMGERSLSVPSGSNHHRRYRGDQDVKESLKREGGTHFKEGSKKVSQEGLYRNKAYKAPEEIESHIKPIKESWKFK